jgi:hypothetical protein
MVTIGGICSIAFVVMLFVFTGQSPRGAAAEFMSALAQGDIKKLTDLSVVHNDGKDEISRKWTLAMNYGRNYIFTWNITAVTQEGDAATVRLERIENPLSPSAAPEKFELLLVKANGGWKVDVPQINRSMFPYLPQ